MFIIFNMSQPRDLVTNETFNIENDQVLLYCSKAPIASVSPRSVRLSFPIQTLTILTISSMTTFLHR